MAPGRSRALWLVVLLAVAPGLPAATAEPAREPAARVTEGPRLPLAVAGHFGGLVGGVPVVAGGSSWSGNPKTKSWRRECFLYREEKWVRGPDLPYPLSDAAYAADARGLFAAGGTTGERATDRVLQLVDASPSSQWRELASLPQPVEAASGAVAGSTLYVVGGFTGGRASNRLWALDLDKPGARWRSAAALPAPGRAYSAFVNTGESLLLLGGFVSPPYEQKLAIFADAYCYDPSSDKWLEVKLPGLEGYAWTASLVGHRQIMLTGRVSPVGQIHDDIWILDLDRLSAKSIGRLVTPACCMPAIRMRENVWWLPGGEPDTQRSRTDRTSVIQLQPGIQDE